MFISKKGFFLFYRPLSEEKIMSTRCVLNMLYKQLDNYDALYIVMFLQEYIPSDNGFILSLSYVAGYTFFSKFKCHKDLGKTHIKKCFFF